jgi:hypothetical protein
MLSPISNRPYEQSVLDLHCPVYQKMGGPSTQQDRLGGGGAAHRELRLFQVRCVRSGRNMALSGREKKIAHVT